MKKRAITFFLIYNLLTLYIGWNVWVWVKVVSGFEHLLLFWIVLFVSANSFFISRLNKRLALLKIIGAYWIGLFQYAVLSFPIANIVYLLLINITTYTPDVLLYYVGIIVIIFLLFIFFYGTYNAYNTVVRTYSINIPKKVKKIKKLRIAMASDMHFGLLSGTTHLKRLVKIVNELKPDLILFLGDIIDDDPDSFKQKNMGTMMKQMKSPLGVYGVLGNHEYYGGKISEFIKEMTDIEVKILLDEVILLEDSIYLIGRRDRTEKKRKTLEKLLETTDKTKPHLLMDHQPFHLEKAEHAGVDLMLSGHTHRGQMAPNHLITRKMYEVDWGYLKKNNLHTIVSSGFGFWGPPLRIGSRSEVVEIEITFK
ncbi:metallophosphoesterase [Halalkalibacter urbisdiaboli]|uniref:metallophosphoesterase n=1 Tax=Halalkalibacter urbisdiaboli TaxID=1960589 RepID=UPI000B4449C0|nr:metallophosphoesterase [Halalkalibacter urbisdiaboli]